MCSLQNIQLSGIYSLSSDVKHNNLSVASVIDVSGQVSLVEKPTDPNDYKPVNKLDLECISIEDDAVSISSNESCCDIIEVGAWIPKNVHSTKNNSKGKNHYNPSSPLTDKHGVSNKPKLYVSQTVSSPLSKLEKSTLRVKTTAKVDCVNTHPVYTMEATLSPPNMTRRVLDVSQTLSTSSSLQNNTVETVIHFQQHKLPRIKTSSIVSPQKTGIETSSRNPDIQGQSSSSVGDSGAPSDRQTKHEPLENVGSKSSQKKSDSQTKHVPLENVGSKSSQKKSDSQTKHVPLENVGSKSSQKNFCCTPRWLTSMYGEQLKCTCPSAAGSSSVRQPVLEGESYKDNVTLVKDLNNGNSSVEKGTTSTPEVQLRLPLSTHRSNDNSKKTQAYIIKESCELGRRRSQISELSKEENSYSKEKQESNLTSVLELKISRKRNKSKEDLLEDQEKAHHCDLWLYKGKERKNTSRDSDIISVTSNESSSDIMEAEVSIPKSVRKDLLGQYISQEVTPSLPMSGLENGTSCTEANMSKARNKNISNTEDLTLYSITSGAMPADKIEKVLNIAQSHRTLNSLRNDGKRNSIQSEQNKLVMNEEKGPFVHPKQPDTLTTESTVCYQDTGPEPSKMSCRSIDKVRGNIRTDCQATTLGHEVVQDNQIEYNTQHPGSSDNNKYLTKSEDGGLQGFNDIIPEIREEHSLTSVIEDGNTKQESQILPPGDQEYQHSWTDQLSEIIMQFPSGMLDKNTIRSSPAKENAEIKQERYSKEVIDNCLNNFEGVVKQLDEEYNSILCGDRRNPVLHSATPSDNPSNETTAEEINDTSSEEFCCILSWSGIIVGENSKCSCPYGSNSPNSDGDEINQSGNTFPVIEDTKASTVQKDTRSADQPSRPQMKTQGNICDQPMEKGSINSGGRCESASGLNNSPVYSKTTANKGSRKRKTQPTDMLQLQEGIAKSSSSEVVDNTQGLVQCDGSLFCVSNTASEKKQKTSVKKKKGSDNVPKKAMTTLTKEVHLGQQAKFLPTVHQMGRDTGQCHWASQNNPEGKQDCNNQLSRKNKPNERHQSKSQAGPKSSKNVGDRAVDKASTGKKSGKKQLKDCEQHKRKTTGNKIQHTRPGKPKPESFKEAIQTFASPNLDVNRKQIDRNRGSARKTKDNSELHPKKVEQSPQIQLSRNIFVKKGGKDKDVSHKKNISSTLTRDSGLDLQSKMALYKDGSSSRKHDNVRSSLSKPDKKAAGQVSKKVLPLHHENQYLITKYVTRPKGLKESFLPGNKSTELVQAKSHHALKQNISEQTILSKKALEKCSSPLAKVKDPLTCNINTSDSERCSQDIQNLDIHNQEVQKNQATKSPQNTQVTPKKSVNFDTRVTFHDLETKTGCQLRKLDAEQELAKGNNTLVYMVNKTTSIAELNSKDLKLLPKVQESAQETSIMCDRIKERCEQDKKNQDHLTSPTGKKIQNAFVQEGSFCILPEKIPSRGDPLDLQRETVSPIVHPGDQQPIQKCCAEITSVVQETKHNDEGDKCGQKLENKHGSGHEGKKQTEGQRKRKASNPGAESGSPKRRKSGWLNENTSCAEKEPNQDLEQTSGCQLGHIGGAAVSPKSDSSVAREKASSTHRESQKSSYLENKPNLHPKEQRTEADVTRDKSTCPDGNQNFCIPSDKTKDTSSKKVGIEEGTKSEGNSQEHLEKVASPTCDTEVKSPETSHSGRPIGQSPPKEKSSVRECALKLFRLPLPLEKLDNPKSPGKVDGKAEAEQREK